MSPDARAGHVRARVNSLYGGGDNGLGQMRTFDIMGRPEPKNYYTAEIAVNRKEMDLPALIRLLVDGSVVGRWSLLAMPPDGLAQASLPLQDFSIGNQSMRDIDPDEVVLFLEEHMITEIRRVRMHAGLSKAGQEQIRSGVLATARPPC